MQIQQDSLQAYVDCGKYQMINPVRATHALRFQMAALDRHLSYRTLTTQQELGDFSNGVKELCLCKTIFPYF